LVQMRLDMHLGDRTKEDAEQIARNVAKLLRAEVFLVLDSTERVGKRFEATSKHGKWADGISKK